MEKFLAILGFEVEDIVTGFKGVASSVDFQLYGCVQVAVNPKIDKKAPQLIPEGRFFDFSRLKKVGKKAVLVAPDFNALAKPKVVTTTSVPGGQDLSKIRKA